MLFRSHPLLDTTYGIPVTRSEIMHPDRSTYFLESADEILSWTPDDLCGVIKDLYNKQGNNKLLTKEMIDGITNSDKRNIFDFLTFGNCDRPTKEIIMDHMSRYCIGGYDEFEISLSSKNNIF